jgi:hypothetical protein
MRLGARLLTAVGNVNVFSYATEASASVGDPLDVYLQLVDTDQHLNSQGFFPAGNRYMPASGAVLLIDIQNLDDAKAFTRAATQPFAQDPSIWRLQILATDPVAGTVSLRARLTESGITRSFTLQAALLFDGDRELC